MHSSDILKELSIILEKRKQESPETSYVASLYHKGEDKILEKVGEEAIEAILASKSGDKKAILAETADLWFHSMIMLAQHNLCAEDVLEELARRSGISGHDEKASRKNK